MTIDIKDGQETRTIPLNAEVDAAIQKMTDRFNASQNPPTNLTRAQYLRARFIEVGQSWLEQIRREREEAHVEKFRSADESKKTAAEAAVQ